MSVFLRESNDGENVNVHIIPVGNNEPMHVASARCHCSPLKDPDSRWVFVHHSSDNREARERVDQRREGNFWIEVGEEQR